MTRRDFTLRERYEIVGDRLASFNGRLLDVGSRDRILSQTLPASATYYSADTGPGHDFVIDLESPIPFAHRSYDAVVALDVLEHVEQIHSAFHELAEVTDKILVISLPNIAVWTRRWQFLQKGNIGGKYTLLPDHQGDRHRWVTIYPEIIDFVEAQAARAGLKVTDRCEEVVVTRRPLRWLARLILAVLGPRNGALIERVIFFMRRDETASVEPA